MALLFGQLLYTSFPEEGFKVLTSPSVPADVREAFLQRIVYRYWDCYSPPDAGHRSVYLHQVSPEHCLFGWLYGDGTDDLGRSHVPTFICYHLTGPLQAVQLENVFACLHRGPVGWVDKQSERVLEAVTAPDLWNYSAARMGVGVPAGVYERGHSALETGQLIDLFVTFTEQGPVAELNTQPSERWDQAVSGWLRKIQARQVLAQTQLATRAQYDEATSYAATVASGGLPVDTAHTRLANHRLGLQVAPISTTSADIVSSLNRAPGNRDRRTNSPASSKPSVAAWATISALVGVVVLLTFRTQVSPDPAPEPQPQTSTQAQLPGQSGVATPRVVEPSTPKTVIAKTAQARPARKPTSSRQERKIARLRPEKLRSSKQTARKVAQNTALSPQKPAAPKARQVDVAQKVDLLMLSND